MNFSVPADADPKSYQPIKVKSSIGRSEALSMANTKKDSTLAREIAILVADGVNEASLTAVQKALTKEKAVTEIIAPAVDKDAEQLLDATYFKKKIESDEGILIGESVSKLAPQFIGAIAQHRFWDREKPGKVPA